MSRSSALFRSSTTVSTTLRTRPGRGPTARSLHFVTTRIGINGFGRIGRQTLKAILQRHPDELEVVAVNDLADDETNAHLFKYDSTYGRFDGEVRAGDNAIVVDGRRSARSASATRPRCRGATSASTSSSSRPASSPMRRRRGPSRRRRPEGDHQRPGEERGRDDRPRRQRGPIRPGAAPHRQQRQLHDERARPAGEGRSSTPSGSSAG